MQLQRRDLDLHFILDKYILPQFESVQPVPLTEKLVQGFRELQPRLYQFGMEAKGDFAYCDVEKELIESSVLEVENTLTAELEKLKNDKPNEPNQGESNHCCYRKSSNHRCTIL